MTTVDLTGNLSVITINKASHSSIYKLLLLRIQADYRDKLSSRPGQIKLKGRGCVGEERIKSGNTIIWCMT